jgi:hypothetical protein
MARADKQHALRLIAFERLGGVLEASISPPGRYLEYRPPDNEHTGKAAQEVAPPS